MAIKLSELKKEVRLSAPRILFYAVPKFGKTTFASQAPNPIFIPTEDGFDGLAVSAFPVAKTLAEFSEYLTQIATEKHEFKTVVVDTLDRLEQLIWEQVVRDYNKDNKKNYESIEEIGYAKGYTFALRYWNEILSLLDQCRDNGMAVILLAHSVIKPYNPPDSEGYDRYRMTLHDKASNLLMDRCDAILFGNYEVFTKETKSKDIQAVNNEAPRALYTEERPAHWGGNRYALPYKIPFVYGKQWETFEALLLERFDDIQKTNAPKTSKKAA